MGKWNIFIFRHVETGSPHRMPVFILFVDFWNELNTEIQVIESPNIMFNCFILQKSKYSCHNRTSGDNKSSAQKSEWDVLFGILYRFKIKRELYYILHYTYIISFNISCFLHITLGSSSTDNRWYRSIFSLQPCNIRRGFPKVSVKTFVWSSVLC